MKMRNLIGLSCATVLAAGLAGCGGAAGGGDPGAKALPIGQSCQSIRSEMVRLENRGVQAVIERQQAGGKVNANQKVDADNYNTLLGQYLGSRCHV